MLAQFPLHNNKIFLYMNHILYRYEKTKIVFENYSSINRKRFWPTLNNLKFYIITYFIKCIQVYGSVINYNIVYSKILHKYLFKIFYT